MLAQTAAAAAIAGQFSGRARTGKGREVAYSELAGHQNKGSFFVMAATRCVFDKENNLPANCSTRNKIRTNSVTLSKKAGCSGMRKDLHNDYVVPFMQS
jgi:hypothetical protein